MNLLRSIVLILCIITGVLCIYGIFHILSPLVSKAELAVVFTSMFLFWISMEFGVFAFHSLWHDYTSKKIQKELDTERSFRKLGGDL